jgi:hypothetical protein
MKKSSAKFFGKSLLALALGIIAVAGLAVAGLLSYYGRVVGTVTVKQAVVLDESPCVNDDGTPGNCDISESPSLVAGDAVYTKHTLVYRSTNPSATTNVKVEATEPTEDSTTLVDAKYVIVEDPDGSITCNEQTGQYSDSISSYTLTAEKTYALCIQYTTPINVAGSFQVNTTVSTV